MVPMTIGGQKTVLLTLQDTTELRQMEAELRQVQKIDSIGQLAGGVAHDFNNILAAISLRLTLLHDGPGLDEETAQTIREIEESVARAANLTRQLLVFSRRSVPHIQVVNLETIVQGTLAMLSRLLGARIAIQFDNAAGTASAVKADPALLEQVVMNLVINARDAMAGQGTLAISLRKVELDGDYPKFHPQGRSGAFIRLSVADTGTGMDEATLGRIFEPFFTTKPAGAGTGLGLSTVFRIVKQHAGWIQVESKPGIGSTFHVYLPVPNGKPEPDEILPQPFTVAAAQQPAAALHS
jgi:signal transduction histidine kinase